MQKIDSRVALLALSLVGPATGCATLGSDMATAETAVAKVLISPDQESQLGLQVKQQIETQQNVRYIDDPAVVDYVRGVENNILGVAKAERPEVNWTVNVIDDPKTINAFATPGGYLYVYTGLLLLADNEAELASVMGHETGHVIARHSARQMVDQYGIQAVEQLALGNNPGLLTQLGTSIANKGAMLAHSRGIENEADEYGARYASKAGYDPHALATLFTKLKAKTGDTSGISTWISDHPATGDRITHINTYVQQNGLGGAELAKQRFAAIKARLDVRYGQGWTPPSGPMSSGGGVPPSTPPAPPAKAPASSPPPSGAPPN